MAAEKQLWPDQKGGIVSYSPHSACLQDFYFKITIRVRLWQKQNNLYLSVLPEVSLPFLGHCPKYWEMSVSKTTTTPDNPK